MSYQLNNRITESLKFVLITTLAPILSGCYGPWDVYRSYEGPERPLEDVAVLFTGYVPNQESNASCWIVDGSLTNSEQEVHLLPGIHAITCTYLDIDYYSDHRGMWQKTISGKPITTLHNFKQGQAYKVVTSLDEEKETLRLAEEASKNAAAQEKEAIKEALKEKIKSKKGDKNKTLKLNEVQEIVFDILEHLGM